MFGFTEAVKYYTKLGNKLFCAFLEASKAFDKVHAAFVRIKLMMMMMMMMMISSVVVVVVVVVDDDVECFVILFSAASIACK